MFRRWRLKKIHAKFLESCRSQVEGRNYWANIGPIGRWFLQAIVPMPLLGLHPEGEGIYEALQWLEANCRAEPLGEETMRNYHRKVYSVVAGTAGAYRRGTISVLGSKIPRAAPERVTALMNQLDLKLRDEQRRFDETRPIPEADVFGLAVDLYQRIGLIHPFPDANGRVARLAMNHLLRRYGLGYVILPPLVESGPLWDSLQEAHLGRPDTLLAVARKHVFPA